MPMPGVIESIKLIETIEQKIYRSYRPKAANVSFRFKNNEKNKANANTNANAWSYRIDRIDRNNRTENIPIVPTQGRRNYAAVSSELNRSSKNAKN